MVFKLFLEKRRGTGFGFICFGTDVLCKSCGPNLILLEELNLGKYAWLKVEVDLVRKSCGGERVDPH